MSELPGYPESDLNQGRDLLVQLGSFWSEIFGDRDVLQTHLRSSAHEQAQSHLDFLEAVASVSRFTVPVFHKEDWHLITFRQSDAQDTPSVYRTGDLVYGQQPGTVINRPAGFVQTYGGQDVPGQVRVPLPDTMVDAPVTLQNLVVDPSRVLAKDIDYDVEKRYDTYVLRFREDPFTDDLIPRRDVVDDDGNVVDVEIALWAYKGDFDLEHIWIQFGYVMSLQLESSQFYKDLLNAVWDSHVLGFSRAGMEAFLAATSGAPIILNPRETVEVVRDETDSKLVVTDANVYRVPAGGNVLLSVGTTYLAGTAVSDAFSITELAGHDPDYSAIPALALNENFLSGDFLSELFVEDKVAEVEYHGLDEEGRAFVTFQVSGFPADVELFWRQVQERGRLEGQTLANLLDQRTDPQGEPTAADLPATLNPLQFMLDIMKNNLFVLQVKPGAFDDDAPGLGLFRALRNVMPPHTTYVVFIEITPDGEIVDLSQAGGEDEPGAEDSAGTFHGSSLLMDELFEASSAVGDVARYDDAVTAARQISSTCQ